MSGGFHGSEPGAATDGNTDAEGSVFAGGTALAVGETVILLRPLPIHIETTTKERGGAAK